MALMFCKCKSLITPPDFSNLDLSSVTSMNSMFDGCKSLVNPPLFDNSDTQNLEDLSQMFVECDKLVSSPTWTNCDLSKLINMGGMHAYDNNALVVGPDFSNHNLDSLESIAEMFYVCPVLAIPPKFPPLPSLKFIGRMFDSCVALNPTVGNELKIVGAISLSSYTNFSINSNLCSLGVTDWGAGQLIEIELDNTPTYMARVDSGC